MDFRFCICTMRSYFLYHSYRGNTLKGSGNGRELIHIMVSITYSLILRWLQLTKTPKLVAIPHRNSAGLGITTACVFSLWLLIFAMVYFLFMYLNNFINIIYSAHIMVISFVSKFLMRMLREILYIAIAFTSIS